MIERIEARQRSSKASAANEAPTRRGLSERSLIVPRVHSKSTQRRALHRHALRGHVSSTALFKARRRKAAGFERRKSHVSASVRRRQARRDSK